jgi:hypothetical protein
MKPILLLLSAFSLGCSTFPELPAVHETITSFQEPEGEETGSIDPSGAGSAPVTLEVRTVRLDAGTLLGWEVLFRPFSILPGGKGEGLFAVVSARDFDRWLRAAKEAGLAGVSEGYRIALETDEPRRCSPSCVVSYLSHYEEGETGSEPEPVSDSMRFGMDLALRGARTPGTGSSIVRFEAEIAHAPGGSKMLGLQTAGRSIHLPNVSRKRFAGTAPIEDSSCLVLLTAPLHEAGSEDAHPDRLFMVAIRRVEDGEGGR